MSHVNRAPSIANWFASIQKQTGKSKVLVQDVQTRWNSTYCMLERFQELKLYVLSLLSEHDFDQTLTGSDWLTINSLINLLKPFEAITRLLSSNCLLNSEIIPSIRSLKLLLQQPSGSHAGVGTLKSQIIHRMNERFSEDIF